jgi:hypothetical protein
VGRRCTNNLKPESRVQCGRPVPAKRGEADWLGFHTRVLYIANALVDQHIGLEETDDGVWAIHFHSVLLATFDERDYIITG